MQDIIDQELDQSRDSQPPADSRHQQPIDAKPAKPHLRLDEEDEMKTVKIQIGVKKPHTEDPLELRSVFDQRLPHSTGKLNLSNKKQTRSTTQQSDVRDRHGPDQPEDQSHRVKESLQEYERISLQREKQRTMSNTPVSNLLGSTRTNTSNRTRSNQTETAMTVEGSKQADPSKIATPKEEPKEDFIFYERETAHTFTSYMTSKDIHLMKKIANVYFLLLFIHSAIFSIVALVQYTESKHRLGLGTSVVYYLYFGLAMLLRFSFYIFTQLELHGKILYTWKVPASDADPPLDSDGCHPHSAESAGGLLQLRVQEREADQSGVQDSSQLAAIICEAGHHVHRIRCAVLCQLLPAKRVRFWLAQTADLQEREDWSFHQELELAAAAAVLAVDRCSDDYKYDRHLFAEPSGSRCLSEANLGLFFETLTLVSLLLSSATISVLNKRLGRNLMELPLPPPEDRPEEAESLKELSGQPQPSHKQGRRA